MVPEIRPEAVFEPIPHFPGQAFGFGPEQLDEIGVPGFPVLVCQQPGLVAHKCHDPDIEHIRLVALPADGLDLGQRCVAATLLCVDLGHRRVRDNMVHERDVLVEYRVVVQTLQRIGVLLDADDDEHQRNNNGQRGHELAEYRPVSQFEFSHSDQDSRLWSGIGYSNRVFPTFASSASGIGQYVNLDAPAQRARIGLA